MYINYNVCKYAFKEISGKQARKWAKTERIKRPEKVEGATGLRQNNKRADPKKKVEPNDSPEIPDRGETSEMPSLPQG